MTKRSDVEKLVANAEAALTWKRAVARVNAATQPRASVEPSRRPKVGWGRVVAQLNGRMNSV